MEPVIPDFAGKTILIAKIDHGFYLWTADNWEIRLAVSVVVSAAGAQPVEIEVDVPDSPLPPELDVVGATITQLLVAEDGHLGVQLADRQLTARVADDYEAWQIAGQDGERLGNWCTSRLSAATALRATPRPPASTVPLPDPSVRSMAQLSTLVGELAHSSLTHP
jgi:hypothetical protein